MRLHRRSFLTMTGGAAAAGAFGFPMPAVKAATAVKFTLPWLPLGTFAFTFVAKAKGYWEKRGLDVTIDRGFGSGRVCVPVDQGQYDFGMLDLAVMMNCAGRGLDLVAIGGIWPKSPIGIFARKDSGIVKAKDLEGQTVGFDVGSGDFQLWPAFLKATGIDDSKVKKVTMSAPALMKALVEGQVKAVGNFYGSIAQPVGPRPGDQQHPVRGLWGENAQPRGRLQAEHGREEAGTMPGVHGRHDGGTEIRLSQS